jgi:hypothetical protein
MEIVNTLLALAKDNMGFIITALLGGLALLVKDNQKQRRANIALGAYHAYHVVADIAARTPNKIDDKVAEGLKIVDQWMATNGWRALKSDEAESVKLQFSSLHGQEKLALKSEAAPVSPQ